MAFTDEERRVFVAALLAYRSACVDIIAHPVTEADRQESRRADDLLCRIDPTGAPAP